MTFTDELWHSIEPIYAAILRHPFIAGLTDGSLPRELRAVLDAANEVAAGVGDAERTAMHRHFRTTSLYEWMFSDMGYRCERWPVDDLT